MGKRSFTRDSVVAALHRARRDRDLHSNECPHWDYESNGGCDQCEWHDREVRKLAKALSAF